MRSLSRPVSGTVHLWTGDSVDAPGLFCVDADTSPFGSEDATPGFRACVPVRALRLTLGGRVGRAGLPGALWCTSPFLWPCVLLLCFAPSGLGLPLLVGLFAFLRFFFVFLLPLCPRCFSLFSGIRPRVSPALALVASSPPSPLFFPFFFHPGFRCCLLGVRLPPPPFCCAPPASFFLFFPFCLVLVFVAASFVLVSFPFALLFLFPTPFFIFFGFFPVFPPPCVRSALCCLVSLRCAAVPSGVLRCRVAIFCAAWRAVLSCFAWLWAAVAFCVFCCVVPCCWLLLCVVPGLSSYSSAALLALWLGVLFWSALPCAVLCPWVLCCSVLLRVAQRGVVLLCAALCCLAPFSAAARCYLPSRAVRFPGTLCVLALCAVLSPRAVCSALCLFFRGHLVRAVVRRCALCSVRPMVSCCAFAVLSVLCGAALCCAGAVASCSWRGLCCFWRLVLPCAVVCCAEGSVTKGQKAGMSTHG